jgi:diacylglycerol kinase (ATP)
MTHSAWVILNPAAGQARREALLAEISGQFGAAGWTYDVHELSEDEDLPEISREARSGGYDLVVAAGGDGTVCGVAGGLVGSGIPMGLIPTGTGNVLAQDLGVPLNRGEAIKLLLSPHKLRSIDAMKSVHADSALDRYYFLNISIGMSSGVMLDTDSDQKRHFGFFAYVFTILRNLAGIQPAEFDIHVDDHRYQLRAADIVIANSGVIGLSALRLDQHIALDDGEVSVCIVRARSAVNYVQTVGRALLSRNRSRSLWCIPAHAQVTIRADRPLPVQADGDPIGQQEVQVIIVPRAVSIVVPGKERMRP